MTLVLGTDGYVWRYAASWFGVCSICGDGVVWPVLCTGGGWGGLLYVIIDSVHSGMMHGGEVCFAGTSLTRLYSTIVHGETLVIAAVEMVVCVGVIVCRGLSVYDVWDADGVG